MGLSWDQKSEGEWCVGGLEKKAEEEWGVWNNVERESLDHLVDYLEGKESSHF